MSTQNTTIADLSEKKLAEIPEETLAICDGIEELNLTGNRGIRLHGVLRQFTNVKKLVFNNCALCALPDDVWNMKQLEELLLGGNDFSGGLDAGIGSLTGLKKLHLNKCKLRIVPDRLGDLKALDELVLAENNFSDGLNPAIGRLRSLKILDLSLCELTTVPDWLGDLNMLECLDLSRNLFFDGLSPSIERLHRLKSLYLEGCGLFVVPDWVANLKVLGVLSLVRNNIEEYPSCTLFMKNLENLDLSNDVRYFGMGRATGNCIKHLPVDLAFSNLRQLELKGNPITQPPADIWIEGVDAIKSFMQGIIPGGYLLHADTINIIGDSSAGKTSVAQLLVAGLPCNREKSDPTIVMCQHLMTVDKKLKRAVRINDFGGNEMYHAIMPVFLPTNGLLILVFDVTDEIRERRLRKWLITAMAKSEDLRIIIVGTHADKIANVKEREALEKRIASLSGEIWRSACDEVQAQVNHISSLPENNGLENKLTKLYQSLSNLRRCTIRVVTLSSVVSDTGLTRLYDLIVELLHPPKWSVFQCQLITGILRENPDGLYITMKQVLDIAKQYFASKTDVRTLTTILRDLTKSSHILWIEDHPQLRNYIFHSPQKIIAVWKDVLSQDSLDMDNLNSKEMNEYDRGILAESVLLYLIQKSKGNSSESRNVATDAKFSDVIVNFLQKFNLISSATINDSKRFIIACKLSPDKPPHFKHLKKMGATQMNRVTARLSFIGSIVPLSFFETSLSSMLMVAEEIRSSDVCPWKNGLIITRNGVVFIATLRNDGVSLTAFSQPGDPNPWTILQPVLKRLNDNAALWHGAPPRCAIECPWCARLFGDSNSESGEIEVDLAVLAAVTQQKIMRRICPKCKKCIPSILCFPISSYGTSPEEKSELEEFFKGTPLTDPQTQLSKDQTSSALKKFKFSFHAAMMRVNHDIGLSLFCLLEKKEGMTLVAHPMIRSEASALEMRLSDLLSEYDVENVIKIVVNPDPVLATLSHPRLVSAGGYHDLGMYVGEEGFLYWLSIAHGVAQSCINTPGNLPDMTHKLHTGDVQPIKIILPGQQHEGGVSHQLFRMPTPYVCFSVTSEGYQLSDLSRLFHGVDIMVGPTTMLADDTLNACFPMAPHTRSFGLHPVNVPRWIPTTIMDLPLTLCEGGKHFDEKGLYDMHLESYSWLFEEHLRGKVSHYNTGVNYYFPKQPYFEECFYNVILIRCDGGYKPKLGHSGTVWIQQHCEARPAGDAKNAVVADGADCKAPSTASDNAEPDEGKKVRVAVAITVAICEDAKDSYWVAAPLCSSLYALRNAYKKKFAEERKFTGLGLFMP